MFGRICLIVTMLVAMGIIGTRVSPVNAAGNQVPFKGSYAGTAAFDSSGTPVFNGTGMSSHLGRGTNQGYSVFTTAPVNCPGGVPNDQYETLTAADGDSLTIVSEDVACPEGPGQYHGTGNWMVIAGTGRFSDAKGKGTLDGHSDFVKGVFSIELSGTISKS